MIAKDKRVIFFTKRIAIFVSHLRFFFFFLRLVAVLFYSRRRQRERERERVQRVEKGWSSSTLSSEEFRGVQHGKLFRNSKERRVVPRDTKWDGDGYYCKLTFSKQIQRRIVGRRGNFQLPGETCLLIYVGGPR